MTLHWESAGTDEVGDQNASSGLVEHGYWSVGPTHDHQWSIELIEQDPDLNEIPRGGVHLGHFPSERGAKSAAETFEEEYASGIDRRGDGSWIL